MSGRALHAREEEACILRNEVSDKDIYFGRINCMKEVVAEKHLSKKIVALGAVMKEASEIF